MIPYNPSSFDTNKTILEQILELKKWLQAHPSYEIFYSSENGDTTQPVTNYDLTAIANPTNLEVGDVVIFANVTVAVVTSVDTDNNEYGCDTATSFRGAQGPQGIQGPQGNPGVNGTNGTNGVSITNVQINSNNKLICTLSDGNTIDAGYIWYLINTSTSSSGTLTGPDLTSVNKPYVYWHTSKILGTPKYHARLQLVDGFSETTKVFSTVINDNGTLYQIQIEVDSSTGVWSRTETALSASSVNRVDITTTSGTLSADDLAKAKGTDYCILVYTDNGVELTMSRIIQDSSYVYFYTHYIDNGCAQYSIAEIDASTGAYTLTGDNLPIKADNINSGTATSGQVLTADGNGGVSWQTAGGGGTGKYMHYVYATYGTYRLAFSIMLNTNSKLSMSSMISTIVSFYGASSLNAMFVPCGLFKASDGTNTQIGTMIRFTTYSGSEIWVKDATGTDTQIALNSFTIQNDNYYIKAI